MKLFFFSDHGSIGQSVSISSQSKVASKSVFLFLLSSTGSLQTYLSRGASTLNMRIVCGVALNHIC